MKMSIKFFGATTVFWLVGLGLMNWENVIVVSIGLFLIGGLTALVGMSFFVAALVEHFSRGK